MKHFFLQPIENNFPRFIYWLTLFNPLQILNISDVHLRTIKTNMKVNKNKTLPYNFQASNFRNLSNSKKKFKLESHRAPMLFCRHSFIIHEMTELNLN